MSKISARILSILVLLAGLLIGSAVDTARAQPVVGADMRLCIGNPTSPNITACLTATTLVTTVSPYTPIFYVVTLPNAGATGTVTVTDTFQPGFNFVNATCTVVAGTSTSNCPTAISATSTTLAGTTSFSASVALGSFTLQAGQTVQIVITGYFSVEAGGSISNTANNSVTVTGGATPITAGVQAQVDITSPLPSDLSIFKTASPSSIDVTYSPATVHYKIVITNVSGPAVYLGQIFTLVDELAIPTTSAPMKATFVSGSATCTGSPDCLALVPAFNASSLTVGTLTWAPFLQWRFPTAGPGSAGLLLSGGTIILEYDVRVERVLDCVKQPGGDGQKNRAFFNLTAISGITLTEQNPGNNTAISADVAVTTGAYIVDPDCGVTNPGAPPPVLSITKIQLPPFGPVSWPGTANYRIQVKNNSTQPLFNVKLRDFMREDSGTPPHDVQRISWSCVPNICLGGTPSTQLGPLQPQQFYFAAKQMWSGIIPILAGGQTVTLDISIRFTNPTCDSLDATVPNTNTNVSRASYNTTVLIGGVLTPVTYYLQAAVTTPMLAVPKCRFDVLKNFVGPTLIGFPQTVNYKVVFRSFEIVPRNVVVYDALRVVPANYTAGMPFTATYTCAPNVLGSVTPAALIPVGTTNGTIVNTTLPSQGARIFQSTGFLTFQPGAQLSCDVSVTVNRPPTSDPYCLGSAPGQQENLAYMTVSLIPNNNVFPPSWTYSGTWPLPPLQPLAGPSNWRSLTSKLPRCFNLVVNKIRIPTTTWTPGGPAITYTLQVKNLGDPIVLGPNNPVLTDIFTPFYPASPWTPTCSPALPLCAATWNPTPASNPSKLTITSLAPNQTISATITAPGPFAAPIVPNTATVSMGGPNGNSLWYPKNPATLTASANVLVLKTNSLTVKKHFSAPPGSILPDFTGVGFPINVVCTPYGPSTTVTLTTAAPSQVIPNIPVGSTCNVVEQPLQSLGMCPKPLGNVSLPSTYVPGQNVQIPLPPPASYGVEVGNVIGCVQMSPLTIFKAISNLTNGAIPNVQFPVTITCQPYGNVIHLTVSSTGNSAQTVYLPIGSTCTIVEGPLPSPVSNPSACTGTSSLVGWAPPVYVPGPSTTIQPQPAGSNPQNVRINNDFVCNP